MSGSAPRQPLVVMSNRLPFTVSRNAQGLERRPSPGGLVSALEPVLRKRGGTWIGWPGLELREGERIPSDHDEYQIAGVPLSDAEIQRYYHGFSNRTLWPLCHALPAMASFERKDWLAYQRVNQRFAEVAIARGSESSLVWVQDYHLMLVPERIRLGAPEARLAFFFHIPFPPYDIFRLCPWDRELLQGLLACDLIGFHVDGYARNFLECVERRLGARVDWRNRVVEYGDLSSAVGVFPIGIEFDSFEASAERAPAERRVGERIVLGVDRLDYTKGIPNRIRSFERLLELHPEHREQVTFLQLAVPSRSQVVEYRELKSEIDELVGRVNGRFATASWSPIRYLYRSISRERLAAMYRDADVALVTPLRDGMNLVAKEYVACQVEEPGVLLLSRMAGAAETMREALFVNPYDVEGTAEAIHRALTMDQEERASRMAALRRRERRDNVDAWVESFLEAAAASHEALQPVSREEVEGWLSGYIRDYRLVLFLDYDGTLTPIRDHPTEAVLSAEMRRALDRCAAREDTEVAVVSGRAIADIQRIVGNDELIYAGNHGLEIDGPNVPHFHHDDLVHYRERAEKLVEELGGIEEHGAWTEAKGPTLTFHVRAVPEKLRFELLERARKIISRAGYQARSAHAALEARPPIGWDKGRAVLHILRDLHGPSWSEKVRVVYVGDDETDEDAFRFLAGLSLTFRVGSAETVTAATRRLPNVGAVRAVLEWIADRQRHQG